LTPDEIKILGRFARFAGDSPRRVKRLVNLYQLLKTSLKLDASRKAEATALAAFIAMSSGPDASIDNFRSLLGKVSEPRDSKQGTLSDLASDAVKTDSRLQAIVEELHLTTDSAEMIDQVLGALRNYGPTVLRYSFGGYA
jgi:hypothetical protein